MNNNERLAKEIATQIMVNLAHNLAGGGEKGNRLTYVVHVPPGQMRARVEMPQISTITIDE